MNYESIKISFRDNSDLFDNMVPDLDFDKINNLYFRHICDGVSWNLISQSYKLPQNIPSNDDIFNNKLKSVILEEDVYEDIVRAFLYNSAHFSWNLDVVINFFQSRTFFLNSYSPHKLNKWLATIIFCFVLRHRWDILKPVIDLFKGNILEYIDSMDFENDEKNLPFYFVVNVYQSPEFIRDQLKEISNLSDEPPEIVDSLLKTIHMPYPDKKNLLLAHDINLNFGAAAGRIDILEELFHDSASQMNAFMSACRHGAISSVKWMLDQQDFPSKLVSKMTESSNFAKQIFNSIIVSNTRDELENLMEKICQDVDYDSLKSNWSKTTEINHYVLCGKLPPILSNNNDHSAMLEIFLLACFRFRRSDVLVAYCDRFTKFPVTKMKEWKLRRMLATHFSSSTHSYIKASPKLRIISAEICNCVEFTSIKYPYTSNSASKCSACGFYNPHLLITVCRCPRQLDAFPCTTCSTCRRTVATYWTGTFISMIKHSQIDGLIALKKLSNYFISYETFIAVAKFYGNDHLVNWAEGMEPSIKFSDRTIANMRDLFFSIVEK